MHLYSSLDIAGSLVGSLTGTVLATLDFMSSANNTQALSTLVSYSNIEARVTFNLSLIRNRCVTYDRIFVCSLRCVLVTVHCYSAHTHLFLRVYLSFLLKFCSCVNDFS